MKRYALHPQGGPAMATLYRDVFSLLISEKRSFKERTSKLRKSLDRRLPDYTALVWNVVLVPALLLFRHISMRPVLVFLLWLAILSVTANWMANEWIAPHPSSSIYEVASATPSRQTEEIRLHTREH